MADLNGQGNYTNSLASAVGTTYDATKTSMGESNAYDPSGSYKFVRTCKLNRGDGPAKVEFYSVSGVRAHELKGLAERAALGDKIAEKEYASKFKSLRAETGYVNRNSVSSGNSYAQKDFEGLLVNAPKRGLMNQVMGLFGRGDNSDARMNELSDQQSKKSGARPGDILSGYTDRNAGYLRDKQIGEKMNNLSDQQDRKSGVHPGDVIDSKYMPLGRDADTRMDKLANQQSRISGVHPGDVLDSKYMIPQGPKETKYTSATSAGWVYSDAKNATNRASEAAAFQKSEDQSFKPESKVGYTAKTPPGWVFGDALREAKAGENYEKFKSSESDKLGSKMNELSDQQDRKSGVHPGDVLDSKYITPDGSKGTTYTSKTPPGWVFGDALREAKAGESYEKFKSSESDKLGSKMNELSDQQARKEGVHPGDVLDSKYMTPQGPKNTSSTSANWVFKDAKDYANRASESEAFQKAEDLAIEAEMNRQADLQLRKSGVHPGDVLDSKYMTIKKEERNYDSKKLDIDPHEAELERQFGEQRRRDGNSAENLRDRMYKQESTRYINKLNGEKYEGGDGTISNTRMKQN